jgi:hypothetical protein
MSNLLGCWGGGKGVYTFFFGLVVVVVVVVVPELAAVAPVLVLGEFTEENPLEGFAFPRGVWLANPSERGRDLFFLAVFSDVFKLRFLNSIVVEKDNLSRKGRDGGDQFYEKKEKRHRGVRRAEGGTYGVRTDPNFLPPISDLSPVHA